jgi:hypothetical protein
MIIHVDNIIKIKNSNVSKYKKLGYLCDIDSTIEDGVMYDKSDIYSEEYNEYTHNDFMQILNTSEWKNNEEII